ncbi:hypothetical protein DYB25_011721 [Aphanomyces astaci]|uniref:Transposase Tc1-like domain-containing protein n=1 Tax=Aphanomyces astaci TaxID=112090 RepID=A0A397A160_APHAT|nr:hypothetical protein DYB25_011721 [Aphanomyces astaci]
MGYGKIASTLNLSKATVQSIVKAFKKTKETFPQPRSGRPKVTTEHKDRIILRAIKANRRLSAESLKETFEVFHEKDISSDTIRRRIMLSG